MVDARVKKGFRLVKFTKPKTQNNQASVRCLYIHLGSAPVPTEKAVNLQKIRTFQNFPNQFGPTEFIPGGCLAQTAERGSPLVLPLPPLVVCR